MNWNPDLRAPLTEPGVRVNEGDFILRVNGQELVFPASMYKLFENTSGKQTVLTINSQPHTTGAWEVTVVPIGNEGSLRNRDWIEKNRTKVAEMTDGKSD